MGKLTCSSSSYDPSRYVSRAGQTPAEEAALLAEFDSHQPAAPVKSRPSHAGPSKPSMKSAAPSTPLKPWRPSTPISKAWGLAKFPAQTDARLYNTIEGETGRWRLLRAQTPTSDTVPFDQ